MAYNEAVNFQRGGKTDEKEKMIAAAGVSAAMLVAAGAVNATPTGNTIYVDGVKVSGAAYMINNNNYFKLRDIAAMVNGTDKQFEVTWNNASKHIELVTGKAYTVVGGELALPSAKTKDAKPSSTVVYKNGSVSGYTGYNIGGENNYYKLRDLCKDMDIGVKYDNATKRVDILTTVGYGKEDTVTTPTEPTTPTTPEQPSTPSKPADSTSSSDEAGPNDNDYRQPGDKGIKSVNWGTKDDPNYSFYPSYGNYTKDYQAYLDNCGEEIVTKTIYYYTYCTQTSEKDVLAGFPVEVMVSDANVTQGKKLVSVMLQYIDSPTGSFTLKMPKSMYERTMAGEWVFRITGTNLENVNMKTTINGKIYEIVGAKINGSDVRDTKPTRIRLELAYYSNIQK